MAPVDVRVAQHHGERLVPADLLNGGQIDAGLHQIGDGRMAHDVRRHFLRVETGTDDGPLERPAHMSAMTLATEARPKRWKDPAFRVIGHLAFLLQDLRQFGGDGLSPSP